MLNKISQKNNFDLIRLLLATTVFLVHAAVLSKNDALSFITRFLSSKVAVNSFFVISGFLVTLSYENSRSSKDYFFKRVRRIYPGYLFVILVSAAAGLFLTSIPIRSYFSIDLIKFLAANLSFLNLLQPNLPGVFENNNISAVNGALWTIRFEMLFYTTIPLFCIFLTRFNKNAATIVSLLIFMLFAHVSSLFAGTGATDPVSLLLKITPEIFLYFLCGSLIFHFFDDMEKHFTLLFIISVFIYSVSKITGVLNLIPLCTGIIVIFFACKFKYLGNFGKYGDFSYGIYIWHFPVIQTLVSFGLFNNHPFSALLLSSFLILLFAVISWHLIEKRFLMRTSHYIKSAVS